MPAIMNVTMMLMSRMLAADVLTTFIVSLSMRLNPHIMAATRTHIVPSATRMVRLIRLMR